MTGRARWSDRAHSPAARTALAALAVAALAGGCATDTGPDPYPKPSSSAVVTTPAMPVAPQTVSLIRAVQQQFPAITVVSAMRPNDAEHSTGRAVDFMIPNPTTPAGISLGDAVVAFAWSHQDHWRVDYTLWRRTYADSPTHRTPMEDRGSATANHDDHVHITLAAAPDRHA